MQFKKYWYKNYLPIIALLFSQGKPKGEPCSIRKDLCYAWVPLRNTDYWRLILGPQWELAFKKSEAKLGLHIMVWFFLHACHQKISSLNCNIWERKTSVCDDNECCHLKIRKIIQQRKEKKWKEKKIIRGKISGC